MNIQLRPEIFQPANGNHIKEVQNRMKRTLAIILALLMIFALFAACGKKDDAKTGTSSSGTSSSGTSKPAAGATSTSTSASGTVGQAVVDPTIEGSSSMSTMKSLTDIWSAKLNPSKDAKLKYAFHNNCDALQYIGGVDNGALYPITIFYETPMAYDSVNAKVIPWMVKEWTWTDDLTLRCKINQGITSIMGDPYTAKDFYFTLDWQCHNPAITTFVGIIDFDKCKVIDDYTIDIVVKSPYPFLELEMTSGAWSQVVEASVEKIGGKEATKDDERSGTGAYFVNKWEPNQYIYAERRDDYWGPLPYYKYIDITCVLDSNTRAFGIEAGDYDLSNEVSMMQVKSAADSDKMQALCGSSPAYCYGFAFNTDHEPVNNVEVRRAMAMAVDYEMMVEIALKGFGDVSDSPLVAPANELYTPVTDQSKNFIKFDLDAAKQKMIDAGYPDGFKLNCIYRSNDAVGTSIAELLVNMMGKLKIDLQLSPFESAAYTNESREGNYDVLFAIGANPSPKRFLQPIDPRSGFKGVSGYCGSTWFEGVDIESLIDRCQFTVDKTERMKAWTELNDLCRERVPKFILLGKWTTAIASNGIAGMVNTAYGNPYLWSVYGEDYFA